MKKMHIAATILLVLSLLAGCSLEPDRVTRENYDKLEMGMTYEAVKEIMGEPAEASTWYGLKQYTWVEGERHIHAKFLGNRAVYYSSKELGQDVPQVAGKPSGH